MRYSVTVGDRTLTITLDDDGHHQRVTLDGRAVAVDWRPVGGATLPAAGASAEGEQASAGHYSALIGDRSYDIFIRALPTEDEAGGAQTFEVNVGPATYTVTLQDERTRALAGLAGGGHISGDVTIRAPMPGLVSQVMVTEGATVERGQTIVVLEAMKMENDLTTPRGGIVKRASVSKGQTVNQGDTLAVIGDAPGAETAATEDDEDDGVTGK
ncbi:MAG TPA: biotin/lipoyl-containing protein [Ktedonobacterales bacterium]|nr:biotin/lipoyl-containing protein [Ktedonobacterales bacterium]